MGSVICLLPVVRAQRKDPTARDLRGRGEVWCTVSPDVMLSRETEL